MIVSDKRKIEGEVVREEEQSVGSKTCLCRVSYWQESTRKKQMDGTRRNWRQVSLISGLDKGETKIIEGKRMKNAREENISRGRCHLWSDP